MALMAREAWTDERLDDLAARVDRGFDRVDADIRELRAEMKTGFERIDDRFERIDDRFERIDGRFERIDGRFERIDDRFSAMQAETNRRFDSMQQTMVVGFVTLFVGIVASVIGAALIG
jgi:predicted nuclease with TOPRIM domain